MSLSSLCLCIASYNPSSVLWLVPLAAWGCDEVLLLSSLGKVVVGVWSLRSSLYLLYKRNPVRFNLYTLLYLLVFLLRYTQQHMITQIITITNSKRKPPAPANTPQHFWQSLKHFSLSIHPQFTIFFCDTPILLEDRLDSWPIIQASLSSHFHQLINNNDYWLWIINTSPTQTRLQDNCNKCYVYCWEI